MSTSTGAPAAPGRVLVTGASGFIGSDLVDRLVRAGWSVRAAARTPERLAVRPAVEPVRLPDLSRGVDWSVLLRDVTHVVHLAGIAHATARIAEETYSAVNADAVQALAVAARAAGVARVVMISSVRAQCGPAATGLVTEDREAAPVDAYGRSKLAGERHLAGVLNEGATTWCVLRPVLVYGPGVKGNMARLVQLARLPVPLPLGSLAARRSLLGLPNLAAAVEHGLHSRAASRGTFLVADPEPLTVPQIVAAMREGLGRSAGIFRSSLAPVRLAAVMAGRAAAWERIAGDLVVSTEALRATGWSPVETAREGIARWMRSGA